jgi:hypothetical protein
MSLSSAPDQAADEPDGEYYRTSRQIFRQTFSSFGEAFSAIPFLIFSPILWLTGKSSFWVSLSLVSGLLAFKAWILMLIIGMLHSWSLTSVTLSYQRSFLLAGMLYLLVAGFSYDSSA